jgi:hypothetical protein
MLDYVSIYNSLVARNPFPQANESFMDERRNCLWTQNMPETAEWLDKCIEICCRQWMISSGIDLIVAQDYFTTTSLFRKEIKDIHITALISKTMFFIMKEVPIGLSQLVLKLINVDHWCAGLHFREISTNNPINISDIYCDDKMTYKLSQVIAVPEIA